MFEVVVVRFGELDVCCARFGDGKEGADLCLNGQDGYEAIDEGDGLDGSVSIVASNN